MNKIVKILIICLLILALIVLAGYFFLVRPSVKMGEDGKPFAEKFVKDFSVNYDMNVLQKYGSPEFITELNKDQATTDKLLDAFKNRLGAVKNMDLQWRKTFFGSDSEKGRYVRVTYEGEASFEKGDGTIYLNLIKINNEWQVLNFYINSSNFIP